KQDRPLASNERPSFFDRCLAFFIRGFSSKNSVSKLNVKVRTNKLFTQAWVETQETYKRRIEEIDGGGINLENLDLDTGRNTRLGEHRLAYQAYGALPHKLSKNGFHCMDPALKGNILSFYLNGNIPATYKPVKPATWRRTLAEIEKLKQTGNS